MPLIEQIEETKKYIESITDFRPQVGIILGTGLGGLIHSIQEEVIIEYSQIPNFVKPTVMEHEGRLIFGTLGGKKVICLQGRFHHYEGYSLDEITFPVRIIKALGAEYLFVSNACGGLNKNFKAGQIMCINDHINLLGTNPLVGKNYDELGPRFPDMLAPYDNPLIKRASKVALKNGIHLNQGVYACLSGPSLETRAEYRMLQILGADAIGMSTVPEVIVAVHAGLKVLGLSVITDECLPDALKPVNISEIIAHAMAAEPDLIKIIEGILLEIE